MNGGLTNRTRTLSLCNSDPSGKKRQSLIQNKPFEWDLGYDREEGANEGPPQSRISAPAYRYTTTIAIGVHAGTAVARAHWAAVARRRARVSPVVVLIGLHIRGADAAVPGPPARAFPLGLCRLREGHERGKSGEGERSKAHGHSPLRPALHGNSKIGPWVSEK